MKAMQLAAIHCAVFLSACSSQINDLLEPPALSPVGSGLAQADLSEVAATYPVAEQKNKTWIGGPSDFFRDQRVHTVGDILTVEISVKDRAALSNNSNLSKKSSSTGDLALKYSTLGLVSPDLKGSGSLNSALTSGGQGTTTRSENIELSVAAVVTGVLANGYLLIKGSQEIQVNSETRLLRVSGVVHPADIAENRKVSYDKIAEARITYGGSGTISEVQRPGLGQRFLNMLNPF